MDAETHILAARFLTGYGLADCPLAHCAKLLTSYKCGEGFGGEMRLLETTRDPGRALRHLSLLSWPDSRHVLFPVGDACCALINNSRNGSDYHDYVYGLATHLETRFARVVNRPPRIWSNGGNREVLEWEARMFVLCDASGEVIRSVSCSDDGGRWDFSEYGIRHAIESTFLYDARRKRDRFTAQQLEALIPAFGFPSVTPESFLSAGRYLLFDISGRPVKTCTIAQADDPAFGYYERGQSWLPYMATHATSVIADFERCVRINPKYEPLVRSALDEAYRLTGRAQT